MEYFKQETNYTCGVACFRMVLSQFEDTVPEEAELVPELKTNNKIGTHPKDLVAVAIARGYEVLSGQNGTLAELDKLVNDGYVVTMAISVDVPHYVVYAGNNGNHIFFNDPWYGEKTARSVAKFTSENQKYPFHRWWVRSAEFKKYHPEYNFDDLESNGQWYAFKKHMTC